MEYYCVFAIVFMLGVQSSTPDDVSVKWWEWGLAILLSPVLLPFFMGCFFCHSTVFGRAVKQLKELKEMGLIKITGINRE